MQAAMSEQFGVLTQFLPMVNEDRLGASEDVETPSVSGYKVLIMEGNLSLARLLATGIASETPSVDVVNTLDSAMSQLGTSAYDLLILDLDLPDMDGLKLLVDIRESHTCAGIIALGSQGRTSGMIATLDHGADDYLPKPFSLIEMMARIRALRRRSEGGAHSFKQKADKIILNREQCQVQRDGRVIDLTPREFTLLDYLMQNPGKPLSRALLTQEVWNMSPETNTNIVDVYIKYLRDKLDGNHSVKLIRTIRGMGYSFQAA